MRRRKRLRFENEPEALIMNSLVDIALSLVIGFIVTIPLFFESGIFVMMVRYCSMKKSLRMNSLLSCCPNS
jgi:H+/gluconate symporter-like permease